MSSTQDDVKNKIDKGAETAKKATDKVAEEGKDAANTGSEKLKNAADKAKHSTAKRRRRDRGR